MRKSTWIKWNFWQPEGCNDRVLVGILITCYRWWEISIMETSVPPEAVADLMGAREAKHPPSIHWVYRFLAKVVDHNLNTSSSVTMAGFDCWSLTLRIVHLLSFSMFPCVQLCIDFLTSLLFVNITISSIHCDLVPFPFSSKMTPAKYMFV